MSVDLSAVRGIKGCGIMTDVAHRFALRCADDCPYCLSLLVEGIVAMARDAIRQEAFEEAARLAEQAFGGQAHTHARENADLYRAQDHAVQLVAASIRALAGGKEEGQPHA